MKTPCLMIFLSSIPQKRHVLSKKRKERKDRMPKKHDPKKNTIHRENTFYTCVYLLLCPSEREAKGPDGCRWINPLTLAAHHYFSGSEP
jgi:hypothetical protein